MTPMTRRASLATLLSAIASIGIGTRGTRAQFTEQEVRNGASVVATGDVELNQSASGTQVVTDVNGVPVNGDGIYQTDSGQVVVNDGRVTATGDVSVNQSASGSQTVQVASLPNVAYYDGMPADQCNPGQVIADPTTGQLFYQANDCCYYAACASECKTCKRCNG